jgi:hypothetical protein
MKKEKIIYTILSLMIVAGFEAGYLSGQIGKKQACDFLMFLLESNQNQETHENIKALEGLREDKNGAVIKFMQIRVKVALKEPGIEEKTISRAKAYQDKYCEDACLGLE